jgi:hypothetical protein
LGTQAGSESNIYAALTVSWLFDKVLAELQANPDLAQVLKGQHPLQLACKEGELECIDFFLTQKQ